MTVAFSDESMRCPTCAGRGWGISRKQLHGQLVVTQKPCKKCDSRGYLPHPAPADGATTYRNGTWVQDEKYAYPNGGMTRKFRAITVNEHNVQAWATGTAGIPDTFFSIPARIRKFGKTIRGFLSLDNDTLIFTAYKGE
jgi:hypothetical protein